MGKSSRSRRQVKERVRGTLLGSTNTDVISIYNRNGFRTSMTVNRGSNILKLGYTSDPLGRLFELSRTIGLPPTTTMLARDTYDAAGRRDKVEHLGAAPLSLTDCLTDYTFDDVSRLTSVLNSRSTR